jgi:demethoxyubiquinone hydroxylase (CLK1/Coq7/Cat5 family)
MSTSNATACTVYFDGACPLCRREIAHYRSQVGAQSIAWVDAATCNPAALGGDLSREVALRRLQVRQADGSLVSGAAAFAAIWTRLPAYGSLAAVASRRPLLRLMEGLYSGFLRLRPLWRRAEGSLSALPQAVRADLRTGHAIAVGAVQLYRGILAVARSGELRAFAAGRLASELLQLYRLRRWLPASARSRLLPVWRVAGWMSGALTALLGSRTAMATAAAFERFADRHYAAQIEQLSSHPELAELRATLVARGRRGARSVQPLQQAPLLELHQ